MWWSHRSVRFVVALGLLASSGTCQRDDAAPQSTGPASGQKTSAATSPSLETTPPAEPARPSALPTPTDKPAPALAAAQGGTVKVLNLPGITFTIPEGWTPETVDAGPLAPQAAFKAPPADGDSAGPSIRITHYPSMKGMNEANIQRWLAQVTKADGTPFSPTEVTPTVLELGKVKLTIVDLTGTVATGMGTSAAAQADHRMIAAIVDHPQGPHFVKAVGPVKSMEKWKASVDAFLKSATTS